MEKYFIFYKGYLDGKTCREMLGQDMVVYLYLYYNSSINKDNHYVIDINIEEISKDLLIEEEAVAKSISRLESLGVIRKEENGKYILGHRVKSGRHYKKVLYLANTNNLNPVLENAATDEDVDEFFKYFKESFKSYYHKEYEGISLYSSNERKIASNFLNKLKKKNIDYKKYIDYIFREIAPYFEKKKGDPVTHRTLYSEYFFTNYVVCRLKEDNNGYVGDPSIYKIKPHLSVE